MNLTKLVKTGRVEPIVVEDEKSPTGKMLVGWRRKKGSRKHGAWKLRAPRPWAPHQSSQTNTVQGERKKALTDEEVKRTECEAVTEATTEGAET